jgi:hypothetical protein
VKYPSSPIMASSWSKPDPDMISILVWAKAVRYLGLFVGLYFYATYLFRLIHNK